MLKATTWHAVIGQPPPRGGSGTHMPRSDVKSCHMAGCDWTAVDVAKVGPTCHVSSMCQPRGIHMALKCHHVVATWQLMWQWGELHNLST
ncbi:hypothetical protein Tco_1537406 [Tanacetum coccineum]